MDDPSVGAARPNGPTVPLRCIDMTSVTSPQQTDRSGADIPGPRGGQGVRLLVLGTDMDAKELRDRASAAGYELAQRYSARVSHVAYGSGIDPDDVRYTKIREAGLALLPIQACAAELGLRGETAEAEPEPDVAVDVAVAEAPEAADEASRETALDGPLDFPPLRLADDARADEAFDERDSASGLVPGFADESAAASTAEPIAGPAVESMAKPKTDVPLGAAVIGADPWVGEPEESGEQGIPADAEAAIAGTRFGAGHVLYSIVWALIPFATFGLLTPVTFGYAAYRLRSRALALTALGYTLAVLASFVLSAARPHSATPSDAAGALLTIALAGTWIGGTLHALSLRRRVFVR